MHHFTDTEWIEDEKVGEAVKVLKNSCKEESCDCLAKKRERVGELHNRTNHSSPNSVSQIVQRVEEVNIELLE